MVLQAVPCTSSQQKHIMTKNAFCALTEADVLVASARSYLPRSMLKTMEAMVSAGALLGCANHSIPSCMYGDGCRLPPDEYLHLLRQSEICPA
eukprot:1154358-Pelagomonas_calceolata.AAC.9